MKILMSIMCAFIADAYTAYVLTLLWGWFIVTTFSLDELRYIEALGVLLITQCFKGPTTFKKVPSGESFEYILTSIYVTSASLVLGYIYFQGI